MAKSPWTVEHVDFLEGLARSDEALTIREMATRMSKHFHFRVTTGHVSTLMTRMRTPADPFFRNLPYRRANTRNVRW